MIHFQLPRNSPNLYKYIECFFSEESIVPSPVISNSLSYYLCDIKKKINSRDQEWDSVKRYTNPYEYIHTVIPGKKKSIAKKKPLSRSYFKMIELIYFFKILDKVNNDDTITTFHLAEGPGGFIEAILDARNNKNDKYYGMSILDDINDQNIPGWKKSKQFLQDNPNVSIETGIDGTGDILTLDNLQYCKDMYSNKMDIITGDGGFDFSVDFNNQEHSIAKLLFAQVVYAIIMQKKGGCFILKVFDCFMQHTLDILAILSSFYEKVYVTKPQTSRYANSEKYIVCKGFIGGNADEVYPYLKTAFQSMLDSKKNVFKFLNIPLTLLFTTKIEEYNAIFGQQQIENIYYTLSLMDTKNKTEKLNNLIKVNVKKSIDWCIKYGILHNNIILTNAFEETQTVATTT
jgi:23S rRNA U2552 (ribose-2'-O)-methylase RlmE/FtsJ